MSGYSLLELLVAMALVALVAGGVAGVLSHSARSERTLQQRQQDMAVAEAALETLAAMPLSRSGPEWPREMEFADLEDGMQGRVEVRWQPVPVAGPLRLYRLEVQCGGVTLETSVVAEGS